VTVTPPDAFVPILGRHLSCSRSIVEGHLLRVSMQSIAE
jgi:hypothetical protein